MSENTLHTPRILFDDSPRVRRNNPATSHEAADHNNVKHSIGLVLDILRGGPLADFEIETVAINRGWTYTGQRLRTARAALVEKGLVEKSGIYRLTVNGRRSIVWAVTA